MEKIGLLIQEADWKVEKHVPVIECPDSVKADEMFQVKVGLGKEIAHPNTTEHHIRWISLFFLLITFERTISPILNASSIVFT